MTEPLGVTPPELRATAQHLKDVSSRMKDVLSRLRGNLDGEGAKWGDDKIGEQFADGDGGYLSQLAWMDGSVDAKTGLLDYYSRGLKGAADSFEQQDQA
ncbi:WXG100 family type VII secretion target [Mycobacterium sp. MMS18-G62]